MAPEGNQFWRLRASSGRDPKFFTPEELWEDACEYFEWVENNPLWEDKLVTFQGTATHEPVRKMRAMTQEGLLLFLDMSRQTWANYCEKQDFIDVTQKIQNVMRSQKFAGAAADLLNANIIARDLGLTDKQEIEGKQALTVEVIQRVHSAVNPTTP